MALKVVHDTLEEIPEQYRDLYTEEGGKFRLTGVTGVKTDEDISRLQTALTKERADHKTVRTAMQKWEALGSFDEIVGKLDRIPELELATKGKIEEQDAKLQELAEARARAMLAPVDRENKTLKATLAELTTEVEALRNERTRRQVTDAVRAAAATSKMRPEALDDVLLLATNVFAVGEDGNVLTQENPFGVTPGLSADVWLQEMLDKRPHWWPDSSGGGARGSGPGGSLGTNPWSHDGWNLTQQGQVIREKGEEKAIQMAKAAGTMLGGPRPAARK